MMKRIRIFVNIVAAGITAFIILNVIYYFYFQEPRAVHEADNSKCATAYIYEPEMRFFNMQEGFGWGTIDTNGYNNREVFEDIDILICGGSNIEGIQVSQKEHMEYQLMELFSDSGLRYNAYNIGISGASIYDVTAKLAQSLEVMQPQSYIVIELMNLELEAAAVTKVLEGTWDTSVGTYSPIVEQMRRFPYLRAFGNQSKLLLQKLKDNSDISQENFLQQATTYCDQEQLDIFLESLNSIAEEHGVQLAILFHPETDIQKDGSVSLNYDKEQLFIWKTKCREKKIIWADTIDKYERAYAQSYELPYGFINAGIGKGHLNAAGHRMMAEALFEALMEAEEAR